MLEALSRGTQSPATRARYTPPRLKRVLLYGLVGGVLIALLKWIEFEHLVHAYPGELYGGLVAVIYTAVGIRLGLRWTQQKETVVIKEVRIRESGPYSLDRDKLKELAITPREHEILGLIAQGLSNREIGAKLFVSENTVKTHSSRLFDKLGVSRRVQAVSRARELSLVP